MKERALIQRIEDITGQHYDSPRDFSKLSDLISDKTGEHISPSTLKRLWGYVDSANEPRTSTLDILARFIGYKDFESFKHDDKPTKVQSNITFGDNISSEDLAVGAIVRLTWLPDRVCTIEHEGGGRFKVIESVNSKLSAGDTFSCLLIINHEPLYVDKLFHNGMGPYGYVAGKKDGVTAKVIRKSGETEENL